MRRIFTVFLLFGFSIHLLQGQFHQQLQGEKDHPAVPDLFQFKVSEEYMFKLDLLNLVRDLSENGIIGVLHIGYEQKLKTSWSLNAELATAYFFQVRPNGNPNILLGDGSIGFSLAPRFYYDMNKRIAAGKALSNMSANYVSLSVSTRLMQLETGATATDNGVYLYSDNLGVAPLFGVQRRLTDRGYFDFNIGGRLSYGDPIRSGLPGTKIIGNRGPWQFYPVTNLRMGLAF